MSGTSERFRRVAARFDEVVRNVADEAWFNPAPCEGWQARHVVRHLVEWVPAVLRPGVEIAPGPDPSSDPVGAWEALASGLQGALDDPEIAAREFDAGPLGRLTVAAAIDRLVVGDVLVHTWDLARATGQDETIDDEIAAEMLAGLEPIDEILRASGHYGPAVPVPADAGVQTRLIAFTGRVP